jgi:hypothetical protein
MARVLDDTEHRRAIVRGNTILIAGILSRHGHDDIAIAMRLERDGLDATWWLRWIAGDARGDAYC